MDQKLKTVALARMRYMFDLPPSAYTLLLQYLALDHSFCTYFVPTFRTSLLDGLRVQSNVSLFLADDAATQQTSSS